MEQDTEVMDICYICEKTLDAAVDNMEEGLCSFCADAHELEQQVVRRSKEVKQTRAKDGWR